MLAMLVLFKLMFSASGFASCGIDPLPFEKRFANAKSVILGSVKSVTKLKKPKPFANHFVIFKVVESLKGPKAKELKVYYLRLPPPEGLHGVGGYCDPNQASYSKTENAGKAVELLVFAVKKDGILFTSAEWGGGSLSSTQPAKDLEEIKKLKTAK